MKKKPIAITAAVIAAAAAGGGGFAIAASGSDGLGELDADLVGGNTLVMTVEAKNADSVRLTYGDETQTARLVRDDDQDGDDRDFVARFPAAEGDRAGEEVSVKAEAVDGSDTESKTLTDRLDAEEDEDGDDGFGTVTPEPSAAGTPAAGEPAVRDLDAELVRGDTLVLTVEARDAETVELRYGSTTKTATPDRGDADDRDRDFTARFPAAAGDRTNGKRISAEATATTGSASASSTLTDRLDVDTDG